MLIHKLNFMAKPLALLFIFLCLFLMGVQYTQFHFTNKQSLWWLGLILIAVVSYHLVFDRKLILSKANKLVIATSLLFLAYYVVNVDSSIPIKFEYVSFFTLISLIFLSIVLFQNKIIDKKMWIVFVFIYGNLIYLPILLSYTTLIAANSNGIIAFLLLFFCLINLNERNRLFRALNIYNTVLLIFTLFTATSRTAMAAFFIAIIVFFSINYVKKHLFFIVAALVILSPVATITYIYLKYIPLGTTLNDLSIKYTSKNFFSGRDPIWTEAINTVMQNGKFWTGLGNNVQYGSFDGYLHNLYVQVFYQSGFIGLLLIGFLLVSISYTISKAPKIDFEFKVLLAYFIAILFLQIFEGHLIYKLEIISVLSWIIIALLINKSSHADLFKTQSGNVNSPLTTFKKPARSDFT